jgi:ubiquinone/menaquinone biosynthesis C-methylase UbiE
VDYDKTNMAAGYDRGRSYSPEQLGRWLEVVADSLGNASVRVILDLGCGTGRYSAGLSSRLNAHVIGIEPSEKMLSEAKRKSSSRVSLVRASGESLPLANETVEMVFLSMVFHHFTDAAAAIRECRRVLRRDRVACLRADRDSYDAGGCEFGSRREMMKSNTTTTNARIPHRSTPP